MKRHFTVAARLALGAGCLPVAPAASAAADMTDNALAATVITAFVLVVGWVVASRFRLGRPQRVMVLAVLLATMVLGWGNHLGRVDREARERRAVGEAIVVMRLQTNALDQTCRRGGALNADPAIAGEARVAPGRGDAHAVLTVPSATEARLRIDLNATSARGGTQVLFIGSCTPGQAVRWQVDPASTAAESALRLLP